MKTLKKYILNEFLVKNHTAFNNAISNTEFVDLGLPSGTKWATCNFGASSPEQNGLYFMWGSTKDDSDNICDWKHAPFNDGKDTFNEEHFSEIFNDICSNNKLISDYDPVYQYSNGTYCMPTLKNVLELKKYCTTILCENYNDTNVSGVILRSDKNGNEIFLPFSGSRRDDKIYYISQAGEFGTSNYVNPKRRAVLRIHRYGHIRENDAFINNGLPIRPVKYK